MFRSFYPVRPVPADDLARSAEALALLEGVGPEESGEKGRSRRASTAGRGSMAGELTGLWREHGEGYVADGFVRLLNPVRLSALLPGHLLPALVGESGLDPGGAVPVAATALGDVIALVRADGGARFADVIVRHGLVVDLAEAGVVDVVDLVALFEGAPGRNAVLRTEGYAQIVRSCGLPGLDSCLVPQGEDPQDDVVAARVRELPLADAWSAWVPPAA